MITESDRLRSISAYYKYVGLYYLSSKSEELFEILNCLADADNFAFWIDSSGKSDPPPDFYSDKFNLMMDVMEVYDDEKKKGVNSKIKEREIEKMMRGKHKSPESLKLIVNVMPDMKSGIFHCYDFYCKHFERVINEHIESIPLYKKNHPNHKVIFFIWDESTAYVVTKNDSIVDTHLCFEDRNLVKIFANKDIDYVVWYTPYKLFHYSSGESSYAYPRIGVFDAKHLNLDNYTEYNYDSMKSVEKQE